MEKYISAARHPCVIDENDDGNVVNGGEWRGIERERETIEQHRNEDGGDKVEMINFQRILQTFDT